ncbi:hypothetical protein [Kordia jejudonensis]|uniref:hypothetical protein n=1 Tax=Kordia jejudonensis TaxID=1348245 RepID=UPI0006299679|nr:hypothetical protein [Kordia jejudonensis]
MKKIILSFAVVALLFSCTKKEQYYGTWSQYFYSPAFLNINQDSISLSNDGNLWNTYPVTIKNNSLTFLDHTFNTSFSGDSLVFEHLTFKKDTVAPLLEIELPKLVKYNFQEPNPKRELIYIKYGRVPNSNEYKLQLNDKYADISELIDYFYTSSDLSFHSIRKLVMICDKKAKMKDVESIFLEMIKMNTFAFYTVNHTEYQFVDNEIKQVYLSQKQQVFPINNENYKDSISDNLLNYSILEHLNAKNRQYIFLINNEFYVGKEKYTTNDFSKKIDSLVSKNVQFISLFDLNSDFEHYTIFNAILNDSYEKLYDSIAKQKHNTAYNQLTDDKKEEIMTFFPKRNIQNISIPHFLSFEEDPFENIEFPFKNIKDSIPDVYFEQMP